MAENKNWQENAKNWKERYPSANAQLEFFLLKTTVPRQDVVVLLEQFKKFDSGNRGELEDAEALKLLELRGSAKSIGEMRAMVAEIDRDKNKKLSFLEWCCAIFNKRWSDLFLISADPADVEKFEALRVESEKNYAQWSETAAQRANEEKTAIEISVKVAADTEAAKLRIANIDAEFQRIHDEEEAEKKKDEEEKQAKKAQAGAKGRAAMFEIAASVTTDVSVTQKERIKQTGRLNTEKKKADKDFADLSAKLVQAEADVRTIQQARLQADDEVKKFYDEVVAYSAQESLCRSARAEKNQYDQSRAQSEQELKAKAEAEAKAKADAKARLALKASLFKS